MSASLSEIEHQAQQLNAEERAKLAERMLESLKTPLSNVESAWATEIEARVAAYENNKTESFSAEEVFAEARSLSR